MKRLTLHIEGMTCARCAEHVQKALAAVPGVVSAHVNFITKQAVLRVADPAPPTAALIAAVEKAGYKAAAHTHARTLHRQLAYTISAGSLLGAGWALRLESLVLVATVLAAFPILRRAAKSLLARRLTADVLVGIAVIAAMSIGEHLAAGEVAFIML
ncbi:MAG: cation transporter, partial [Verrucomicrobiae bacterium]|nr:cation transporter [Verrucomicrobiae bacterium]